jgi:hypothetical protein
MSHRDTVTTFITLPCTASFYQYLEGNKSVVIMYIELTEYKELNCILGFLKLNSIFLKMTCQKGSGVVATIFPTRNILHPVY